MSNIEEMTVVIESALWQGCELAGNVSDMSYDDLLSAKSTFEEYKKQVARLLQFIDKVEEMTPAPTDIEDDPIWHTHLLELGFHIKELKKEIK